MDMVFEVSGLTAGYRHAVICGVCPFGADAGELVCILGRNGQGKTTLLRTIARNAQICRNGLCQRKGLLFRAWSSAGHP